MSIATTATLEELVDLHNEMFKAVIMLRQIADGSGVPTFTGRFSVAQVDAQLVLVQDALDQATT